MSSEIRTRPRPLWSRFRAGVLPRSPRWRWGALLVAALTAPGLGCASILGEQTTDGFFVVKPGASGQFLGWTQIRVEDGPASVDRATLVRVFLVARDGAKDVRFIQSVIGEAVLDGERTLLVQGSEFPAEDTLAPLDVVYHDDLRPFFDDDDRIRVEWTGTIDPAYPIPEDGIEVGVQITVDVE